MNNEGLPFECAFAFKDAGPARLNTSLLETETDTIY